MTNDTTATLARDTFAAAIRAGNVSAATIRKAARLAGEGRIRQTAPATYQVDSPSGHTYRMHVVNGHRGVCDCPAGRHGRWCAHLIAAVVTWMTENGWAAPETQDGPPQPGGDTGPDDDDGSWCDRCDVNPVWTDDGLCVDCDTDRWDEWAADAAYDAAIEDTLT